jgi:hypothetical protein
MKCSCPDCRMPTVGDSHADATNVGVAAYISAASPGRARYDDTLTSRALSGFGNGIWLCQRHAKLIEDDELTFTPSLLREWKETAEHMAALEARGFTVRRGAPFPDLESKAPKLIAEMRKDLDSEPLVRQFIILSKKDIGKSGRTTHFSYYYEDHDYLLSIITIMEHAYAVYDISCSDIPRYNFTEDFVSFLIGDLTS